MYIEQVPDRIWVRAGKGMRLVWLSNTKLYYFSGASKILVTTGGGGRTRSPSSLILFKFLSISLLPAIASSPDVIPVIILIESLMSGTKPSKASMNLYN